MAFRIYTKTGDKGETSLFGGARLPKHHFRIEAYGTVDELNSYVGLLRDYLTNEAIRAILKEIQDRLFTIGAHLASDPSKEMMTPDLKEEDIQMLEHEIDKMDAYLPELKHFILPGGHIIVSYAHINRCVCRRAERNVVALHSEAPVDEKVIRYLNRLSDYFFILSRKLGQDLGIEEVIWKPR